MLKTILFLPLLLIGGIQACTHSPGDRLPPAGGIFPLKGDSIYLPIPDRHWDDSRPDMEVGWCGETGIQMAMLFYGRYVPQTDIHRAGQPDHPDLYVYNIDTALDALSVKYIRWDDSNRNINEFVSWIVSRVRNGHPVLCGVKIYPDEHRDWSLDHFVLVVGFDDRGLVVNTNLNMDGQQRIFYDQLTSYHDGYSFKNKFNRFFARAITGLSADSEP